MVTMRSFYGIAWFSHCICITLAYRQPLIHFWDYGENEDYVKNGRACDQCSFPFYYQGEAYYGCFKNQQDDWVCKSADHKVVPCPGHCPLGEAYFRMITKTSGPDDDSIILECHGWGSPNPQMIWKKDGETIKVSPPPTHPFPLEVTSNITITYRRRDYGRYSCIVENDYSTANSDHRPYVGTFNFQGRRFPPSPSGFKLVSLRRTYATLAWDAYPETERGNFALSIIPGRFHKREERLPLIEKNTYVLKHLVPDVTYAIKVQRYNSDGRSRYSDPISVTIPADAAVDRPTNLSVAGTTETSVSLKWDWDGELTGVEIATFIIYYSSKTSNLSTKLLPNWREATIQQLVPDTEYEFLLKGFIRLGSQERFTPPVYAKTLPLAPSIEELKVHDDDHEVIRIICKVKARPVADIIWKKGLEVISTVDNTNITMTDMSITSVLSITRTARSYTSYQCVGTSSAGTDSKTIEVKYNANHPSVVVEDMLLQLTSELKALRKDMQTMKEDVQRMTETCN